MTFGVWLRRRRRALDLTREELAARVGCSVSALRKFEADELRPSKPLAELLANALGIASEQRAGFVRFARSITSDDVLPFPAAASNPSHGPSSALFNLPTPPTAMIGREPELAEIGDLLRRSATRLVTLTGPGGIGKTRLALAVAAKQLGRYQHGVWFVSLGSLGTAEGVLSAIADVFKISGQGAVDLNEALRNYLREKALLIILDNFEHVLEAAELVADLLAAPGVQVLVTSRERLRLRAEQVYEVGGLPFPPEAAPADAATFDAVKMFLACVRHARPQHTLDATDIRAVGQICRLAEGMPLAIELAAAWVPTLPVAAIAAELVVNLDLLETTMRDMPQRHRSTRAVFEHSWNLLTAEEQALFKQLSVFWGGFTREAAQHVADAMLGTLARLVDTSLLRAERDGRYGVHELLRQFAEEKLGAEPDAKERTRERHSRFYLEWLRGKEPELKGPRQLHALDEVEREFENVRRACDWALQREQWEQLRRSLRAFSFFMAVRARQLEAVALLQQVVDTVTAAEHSVAESAQRRGLAAYALTSQSWFFARLGQMDKHISCLERSRAAVQQYGTPYEAALHCHMDASSRTDEEEARALFERSLAYFRASGEIWDVAFVINGRGNFAFGRGETLKARELYAEALALWEASGELQGTANGLLNLGRVAYALGDYDQSLQQLEQSLAMQQAVGSKIRTAECLEVLGELASARGQFAEAEARFRQQITILRDLGNRELLSWSLSHLGAAVLAQDRLVEAAELLAEALAIAAECSDPRGLARAHDQLGWLALRRGAADPARQHWRAAVDIAWRAQSRPYRLLILDALTGLAILTGQAGDSERAVELLALVHSVADIDRCTAAHAQRLLADLEARLPPANFAAALARGGALELGTTVAGVLAEGRV